MIRESGPLAGPLPGNVDFCPGLLYQAVCPATCCDHGCRQLIAAGLLS